MIIAKIVTQTKCNTTGLHFSSKDSEIPSILLGSSAKSLHLDHTFLTQSKYLDKEILSEKGRYILLKGSTGFGGTTAALNDTTFCNILATPNTSHVINKEKKIGANGGAGGVRIFYVYQDSTDKWSHVLNYISQGRPFHVYTTFANLNRALEDYSEAITNDTIRIVIDEYQQLYEMPSYANSLADFLSKILSFDNLILTSATHHKYPHHRGVSDLPVKLALNESHLQKRDLEYISNAKVGDVISRINVNISQGVSTYIFTNELDIFKSQINADTLTGDTLALKIAFYSDEKATKEIDPTKNVHIISSSGYEGIDIFESNCEVLIYGKYSEAERFNHLLIGLNGLFQITGRFRNGYKAAKFYVDKSKGFDAFIDAKKAAIDLHIQKLDDLKQKDIYRYIGIAPSLIESAKEERFLDVYDLIRKHKFSSRFHFTYSSAAALKKRPLAQIKPSDLLKRVNQEDAHRVSADPVNYLSYRKLSREDKTKRTGYHSGLNIDDLLIYLIRDFVGDNARLVKLTTLFNENQSNNQNRRGRRKLVQAVYDVISFYVLSNEFGAFYRNSLSERNFNLEYLSKKAKRFNGFQLALLQHLTQLTCPLLGIDLNKNPKTDNLTPQPTQNQVVRLNSLSEKIFNFVWLYNTRLEKGSSIREEINNAIQQYISTEDYKKQKEEDKKTPRDLLRLHKEYLIDVFIHLHRLEKEIVVVKDGRAFSAITQIPRKLRPITPSKFTELDFRQLYPRIAAMWLDSQGHPELLEKINKGDIYQIDGRTREEAKKRVNTAFNLHGAHKRREATLIEIGLTPKAAKHWARQFASAGAFYRLGAQIESHLVQRIAKHYKEQQVEGFRLHDAYIIQCRTINPERLKNISIKYQGKEYTFPLGVSEWD